MGTMTAILATGHKTSSATGGRREKEKSRLALRQGGQTVGP